MFERQLAVRKDRCMLKDKVLLTFTTTVGGLYSTAISAAALGPRVAGVSRYFQRWKIVKLVVKYINPNPGFAVGIGDDPSANGPTDAADIVQLRCSRITTSAGADSNEFVWMPVDGDKWYYVSDEGTVGDVRLTAPCQLAVAAGLSSSVTLLFYYVIEFEGAESLQA